MRQYLDLLRIIRYYGIDFKDDRTGHGRRRFFGAMLRFDISNGKYPLVTTRKLFPLGPIKEMLMFIRGETNIKFLHDRQSKIWDQWAVTDKTYEAYFQNLVDLGKATPEQAAFLAMSAKKDAIGEIGPMYGAMWRCWPITNLQIDERTIRRTVDELPSDFVTRVSAAYEMLDHEQKKDMTLEKWLLTHYYSSVDQLNELVWNLRKDPYSSRHLVTAHNPEFTPVSGYSPDENVLLGKGSLMACHYSFEVFVKPPKEEGGKKRLSLKFNLRSADCSVGTPANIAGYAFLAHLLAHVTDMETDELIYMAADAHIYLDQLEGVEEQLTRAPRAVPTIRLNPDQKDIFAFDLADVSIEGYDPHPDIHYPVAK